MELTKRAAAEPMAQRGRSPWQQAWYRLRRKKVGMAGLIIILIVYAAGVLAPWIAPYGFNDQDLSLSYSPPSLAHPFGTDALGRDQFSRVIWGARTAAIISVLAVSFGTVLGVVLGGLAGFVGRWVDTLLMRISDILFAFPSLLLVILIAGTLKPRVVEWVRAFEQASGIQGLVKSGAVDYLVVFGALSIFAWPGMARLVRGQILSLKETQFVEAAHALGVSTWRIIRRHLLPNAMAPVIVSISMGMGSAVTSEVVLSWLGVGVQPPNPSWGRMIWETQGALRTPYPYLLLAPALTVGLVIFAFNLLGDALNDVLNPRTR